MVERTWSAALPSGVKSLYGSNTFTDDRDADFFHLCRFS